MFGALLPPRTGVDCRYSPYPTPIQLKVIHESCTGPTHEEPCLACQHDSNYSLKKIVDLPNVGQDSGCNRSLTVQIFLTIVTVPFDKRGSRGARSSSAASLHMPREMRLEDA